MADFRFVKTWKPNDIDRMLDLLQAIEEPGFQIGAWVKPSAARDDGEASAFTYCRYHPIVDDFIKLCYESTALIDPYKRLPEDPPIEQTSATNAILSSPSDMETASLNQIRRYLVICTRGEYFGDGYIFDEFDRGCLQAAVRRLRVLRGVTGEDA